jgi:hypothetical protein
LGGKDGQLVDHGCKGLVDEFGAWCALSGIFNSKTLSLSLSLSHNFNFHPHPLGHISQAGRYWHSADFQTKAAGWEQQVFHEFFIILDVHGLESRWQLWPPPRCLRFWTVFKCHHSELSYNLH